jgi:hypothetical protein
VARLQRAVGNAAVQRLVERERENARPEAVPAPAAAAEAPATAIAAAPAGRVQRNWLWDHRWGVAGAVAGAALAPLIGPWAIATAAGLGGLGHLRDNANTQADADAVTRRLVEEERALNRELSSLTGSGRSRRRTELMDQLDDLQRRHTAHVDYLHEHGLTLWTPDRARMSRGERRRFDTAWRQLRTGTGLVRVDPRHGDPQGERELRGMHARLLQGPRGRDLLYELLELNPRQARRGHTVDVRLRPPDTRTRRQRREAREAEATLERRVVPQAQRLESELLRIQTEEGFPDFRTATLDHHAWRDRDNDALVRDMIRQRGELNTVMNDLRAQVVQVADAEAGPVDGQLEESTQPRVGASSVVNLRVGFADSEKLNYDDRGREIPAPAWLIYGHELIHALHNRRGTNATATNADHYRGTHWGNREEHDTIALANLSENDLRDEHDLPAREHHTGTSREEAEDLGHL